MTNVESTDLVQEAWRGYEKLWIVFWIYGVSFSFAATYIMDKAATANIWLGWATVPLALAWYVWSTVALWRCAFNTNWEGWGYFARASVVASIGYGIWSLGELFIELVAGAA